MFKLLTEEERKKMEYEYTLRRGIVILAALIAVVIIGMIGLFPSYVISSAQQREVEEFIGPENVEVKKDYSSLNYWLEGMKFRLSALEPNLDKDRASAFFEEVLKEKVSGIKINVLVWAKLEKKTTVSISGVALDRQSLLAFENRLNTSGKFSSVTLPVSNLAKDRNIAFQIKLS